MVFPPRPSHNGICSSCICRNIHHLSECKLFFTLASSGSDMSLFLLLRENCRVASYCGQHLIWKNERICHEVVCPLLGYWRMAIKLHTKHNGLTSEDRREYETVFDTFFESSCHYGLIIADGICKRQIQLTSRVIRKPHRLPKKPR